MKKLFTLLTLCLLTILSGWGEEIHPTAITGSGNNFQWVCGNIGTGSNPAYNSKSSELRLYQKNTIWIGVTSNSSKHLKKIAFTIGNKTHNWSNFSANLGTVSVDDSTLIWDASNSTSTGVTFTNNNTGSGYLSISRISVEYIEDEGSMTAVDAPTFSPFPGEVASGTEVSMSTTSSDAVIYYTMDGSTPTALSAQYVSPIPVTNPVTFKAIAIKDGVSSNVTTAEYTITSSGSEVSSGNRFKKVTYLSSLNEEKEYLLVGLKSSDPYVMGFITDNVASAIKTAFDSDGYIVYSDEMALLTLSTTELDGTTFYRLHTEQGYLKPKFRSTLV